jgi:excisionase family DNA binding protein
MKMLALMDQQKPLVASETEAVIAKTAADRLKSVAEAAKDINITVDGKEDTKIVIPLPARAVALIHEILVAMADRKPVSLIPSDAELTTQQAADFLNVSRPYLIAQLEADKLNYRKVGSHRRIRFADLLEYDNKCREVRESAIADLNAEAKRLGLE